MENAARDALEGVKQRIIVELSSLRAYMAVRFDKVEERLDRLEGKIGPSKPS